MFEFDPVEMVATTRVVFDVDALVEAVTHLMTTHAGFDPSLAKAGAQRAVNPLVATVFVKAPIDRGLWDRRRTEVRECAEKELAHRLAQEVGRHLKVTREVRDV